MAVSEFGAYFELHVEQGPVLERQKATIGVVTGAQGQRWFDLVVSAAAKRMPDPPRCRTAATHCSERRASWRR